MPGHGTAGGKDGGDIELHNRLHETRADSEAGEASAWDGVTTLAQHIDIDWLKEAYRRTRKDGAVGVDGQTAKEYTANLEEVAAGAG